MQNAPSRQEPPSKNAKFPMKRVLLIALCVFAAVYLLYHGIRNFRRPTDLFAVRPYTADDTQSFTGYLFRAESVLRSGAGGASDACNYAVYDGEKVAVGGKIADVYRLGGEQILSELEALRKEAEILREADRLGNLQASTIDREIAAIHAKLATAPNPDAADHLSDKLLVLLAKKNLMETGGTDYSARLREIEAKCASLVRGLGRPADTVTASESGLFYSGADGLSALFTPEAAQALTPEDYLILARAAQENGTTRDPSAVGTIVTEYRWYYACMTTAAKSEGFSVGGVYECSFPDNRCFGSIPMTLYSKQEGEEGVLLVFTSDHIPSDFSMTRCQRMEAVRATYTGYRVPEETVRVVNGVTCVYVFKEGVACLREIDILFAQDGYFIVAVAPESVNGPVLKLNDLIIVGEKELFDGKIIG